MPSGEPVTLTPLARETMYIMTKNALHVVFFV